MTFFKSTFANNLAYPARPGATDKRCRRPVAVNLMIPSRLPLWHRGQRGKQPNEPKRLGRLVLKEPPEDGWTVNINGGPPSALKLHTVERIEHLLDQKGICPANGRLIILWP